MMIKVNVVIVSLALLVFNSCQKVPVSGRRQLSVVPASEMQSLSYTSYKDFLNQNKLVTNTEQAAMVKRVGLNIQHAVEEYMSQNNMAARLKGFEWEFNLVEDPAVNAWCMPGGKVVIYTGILPVVKNEVGL